MAIDTTSKLVQLRGLKKSYGDVEAVRGVDITIPAGETIAFLGPNGAGKSTTIDMMLGLARPDSGDVLIFGSTPASAVEKGMVGGMLQTGELLQFLTVRELITMVSKMYPNPLSVDEVLGLTGTEEIEERMTTKLSGGQTQRVRMALALIGNPDLLVLDEPTAALDVEGRRDFWAAMRAVAQRGTTIVFATHYLEEADAYADRIVLIARGLVVADGPPTEIKARVGGRTIRATLPDASQESLTQLAGVSRVELRGDAIALYCADSPESDLALRDLLTKFPAARDLEVRGAGLEEAFLDLTGDEQEPSAKGGQS